jgi:hypothetical protein
MLYGLIIKTAPSNNSPHPCNPPTYDESEYNNLQTRNVQFSRPVENQGGYLPCPIIIPQRRPGNQARGWMLGYAPMLERCGIDQTTFLNFIDEFNASGKVSIFI